MTDYVEKYDDLDEDKSDLELSQTDIAHHATKYPKLKAAEEVISDVIDDIRRRMDELEPLVAEQERREADAQRRDYFRGIGPL